MPNTTTTPGWDVVALEEYNTINDIYSQLGLVTPPRSINPSVGTTNKKRKTTGFGTWYKKQSDSFKEMPHARNDGTGCVNDKGSKLP